jgi:uncharacterized protein
MSPDEQQAFAESIRRVRAAAQCQLDDGTSPRLLATELQRGLDRVQQRAAQRGVQTACQSGCDHCCQARVEVLPVEAELIAQVLRERPAREALRERLVEQARHRVSEPFARRPCALLSDHRCSVYAQRPAACRKAHSLDARACASAAPEVPQELALLLDAEALMLGVGQALATPPQELALALLEHLDAA